MNWRRLLIIGPYLLVVAASFLGFRRLEDQRSDECQGRADGRQVLRELVIQSSTGSTPTDLTAIPGYAELDIATQAYLRNLTEALNRGGQVSRDQFRDEALAKLPPINC